MHNPKHICLTIYMLSVMTRPLAHWRLQNIVARACTGNLIKYVSEKKTKKIIELCCTDRNKIIHSLTYIHDHTYTYTEIHKSTTK